MMAAAETPQAEDESGSGPAQRIWRLMLTRQQLIAPDGQWAHLTPIETALVAALVENQGSFCTVAQLGERIGLPGISGPTLSAHVARLRIKLDGVGLRQLAVQAARNRGYVLRAEPGTPVTESIVAVTEPGAASTGGEAE